MDRTQGFAVEVGSTKQELAKRILALFCELKEVRQLEELQAHRFGPHIVMNLTIGIDEMLTVNRAMPLPQGWKN